MDDKAKALQDTQDLLVRVAAVMGQMEDLEHRVATLIEGGRQQLSHLVVDLHLPEMRAELRNIKAEMGRLVNRLS